MNIVAVFAWRRARNPHAGFPVTPYSRGGYGGGGMSGRNKQPKQPGKFPRLPPHAHPAPRSRSRAGNHHRGHPVCDFDTNQFPGRSHDLQSQPRYGHHARGHSIRPSPRSNPACSPPGSPNSDKIYANTIAATIPVAAPPPGAATAAVPAPASSGPSNPQPPGSISSPFGQRNAP